LRLDLRCSVSPSSVALRNFKLQLYPSVNTIVAHASLSTGAKSNASTRATNLTSVVAFDGRAQRIMIHRPAVTDWGGHFQRRCLEPRPDCLLRVNMKPGVARLASVFLLGVT
jgi:hypothetical protein